MSLRTLLFGLVASTTALTIPLGQALNQRDLLCTNQPTVYNAPSGKERFQLLAISTDEPNIATSTWLTANHVGAGQNAPILQNNQSGATIFKFNKKTGDIYVDIQQTDSNGKIEQIPYSVMLTTSPLIGTDAPANSMAITIDAGLAHSNFSFSGATVDAPCGRLVACYLNSTSPYGVIAGSELVWHYGGPMGTTENCADVRLMAIDSF